jgi:hypothetical protein
MNERFLAIARERSTIPGVHRYAWPSFAGTERQVCETSRSS